MPSLVSEASNLIDIKRHANRPHFTAGQVVGAEDILTARKFCYEVYVDRGEIEPHFLNKDGVLGKDKDPCAAHSVYFAVKHTETGEIVAASRLILTVANKGPESLQLDIGDLSENAQKHIRSLPPQGIAEPASYAKKRGAPPVVTMYLLREMLHYSIEHELEYWLIALNPHIEATYRRRFGPALERLGDYISSKVDLDGRRPVNVPYLLDIHNAVSHLENGGPAHRLFVAPTIRQFMRAQPTVGVVKLNATRRPRRLPYQA